MNSEPFIFNAHKKYYVLCVSVLVSLTIGSAVFINRPEYICSLSIPAFAPRTLCYISVSAVSAGLTGGVCALSWKFLPNFAKAYLSILATTLTSDLAYNVLTMITYVEAMQPLRHMLAVSMTPLTVVKCLKEEMGHSITLIRHSIFQKFQVDEAKEGIRDVVTDLNRTNQSQHEFRLSIEKGFKWLENRLGCKDIMAKPFETCLNHTSLRLLECKNKGFGAVCDVVKIGFAVCKSLQTISTMACQDYGTEKITKMLEGLRKKLLDWFNGAVLMRIGVRFELKTTSLVEDNIWLVIDSSVASLKRLMEICKCFPSYMYVAIIIFWPASYLFLYIWGPLSFENHKPARKKIDKGRKPEKLSAVVYALLQEFLQILTIYINSNKDLVIIGALLLLDFYYTKFFHELQSTFMDAAHKYEKYIFDTTHETNVTGIKIIVQMIVSQLNNLQEAIGFDRLVICASNAQPIDYSYDVFIFVACQRMAYFYLKVQWPSLPSLVCAQFYLQKYNQRIIYLKNQRIKKVVKKNWSFNKR